MDIRKGNPGHFNADDQQRQRRCHIADVLERREQEVGQFNICQNQSQADQKAHEGRRKNLFDRLSGKQGHIPLPALTVIDDMVNAESPKHSRIGHIIEHDRGHTLRTKEGQIDRQADKNRIGDKETGDEHALPFPANMQHLGGNAADDIGQEYRGKGQEEIRGNTNQRVMGKILFHLTEHIQGQADFHDQF